MTGQLTFSVLGLLRGWRDDAELALGSPQQHAALSALLLREGRPATVSQLVDAVWGTDQPRSAVQTVRTYISRLRRTFRDSDDEHSISGGLESVADG
jgi:DNA-binding SARP family transcriptional activator